MRKFKKYLFFLLFLICPTLTLAEQIDINTAPLSQLDELIGIGPTYAQRIIDSRPYSFVDDLLRVKGIGTTTLQKIKNQGFACVNCQSLMTSTSTTSIENTTTQQESVSIRADRPTLTQNDNLANTGSPQVSTINQTTSTQKNITKPADRPILLYLSEVLPSPEGPDTENEFIELFNPNNFTADISEFKIKDKTGAIKTFTIPTGTKILANNFLTFKSSQTKISLNNSGDGVELLDPSGKMIDSTDFGKSQSGQSWSKNSGSWPAQSPADNEAGWQWTAKPTPNQANIIVATQPSTTSASVQTASNYLQKTNNFTANVADYSPQHKNFLAVGIATVIALSSALIAWRMKKNSTEI
ncbi:MAG: helix-hairpin-helix domain-containing protein [Candidatus Pacebacteria bacterium]|nr:helix-hairpin-helix domain-containing protein [Candidatus Paceibacterota bacterium]